MIRTASPMRCWRCIRRAFDSLFVHDVSAVGETRGGLTARALTDLGASGAAHRAGRRVRCGPRSSPASRHMLPPGATVLTLDDVRLPDAC